MAYAAMSESTSSQLGVEQVHRGDLIADDFDHIVVIPDVHGDAEALVTALWVGLQATGWDPRFPTWRALWDALNSGSVPAADNRRVALVQLGVI